QCLNCHSFGDKVSLKLCVRCKAALYCSRQCQKRMGRFTPHKARCHTNSASWAITAKIDADDSVAPSLGTTPMNPFNISLTELHQRMDEWIAHHAPTFMTAVLQDLDCRAIVARCDSRQNPSPLCDVGVRKDNNRLTPQFFSVDKVEVLDVEDAAQIDEFWAEGSR
ncbi:hypothetical protein B0H10DRAFT_1814953, partial [Mycena sp. CBHHK59/15]